MSWTHYTNPIFAGYLRTWSPIANDGLVDHYFVIEQTGSTTGVETTFSLPPTTKVSDYCSANGLTLHEGDPDATTNLNKGFTTQGPKVLLLNKDTTENDLSGLASLPSGVSHSIDKQGTDLYEVDADTHVNIYGTLNHDPDREVLVINFNRPSHATTFSTFSGVFTTAASGNPTSQPVVITSDTGGDVTIELVGNDADTVADLAVAQEATATGAGASEVLASGDSNKITVTGGHDHYYSSLKIGGTYNYGVETTIGNRTSYSSGNGLFITGDADMGNWNPRDSSLTQSGSSGTLVGRGGVITLNKMISYGGTLDVKKTNFVGTPSGALLEWRAPIGNANSSFDGFFTGFGIIRPVEFSATLGFKKATIGETISNALYEGTLKNFDVSQNVADYDIGHDGTNNRGHAEWFVVNSATGTDIKTMWRDTRKSVGQRGVVLIQKEVSFNFNDASGSAIEHVELYLEDNPSTYAKDKKFLLSKFVANSSYPDRPNARGEVDTDGNLVYQYADAISYTGTSDSSGNIPTLVVTTGTQIHEYNTNDGDAVAIYGMTFTSGSWRASDNSIAKYSDWDTDRFGGFYKVDRRGNDNTNADLFTFKFCSYGHSLSSSTQALKGLGELAVTWVLFDDALITDTKVNTDAKQEIDTPQKFYNRAKSYLVDNYAGETATIVTRDGNTLDAGSYNVVVDGNVTDAASAFAISGNIITIKASNFVGNIQTTGTITLDNNAEVIGSYGSNTVLPWEVTDVEATATLQLYNITKDSEFENLQVPGTANTRVTSSGTYTGSEVSVGDTIRLRITCQAGTTAFLPYETTGVATTVGISFKADQQADAVYNDNGINADNLTTLSADYPNVQIDISDGDGIADVREFYAFYVRQTTTTTGIEQWFGAIDAIDHMNYRVNTSVADIKLQNTGSTPLVISGARIFRDNGTSILHADLNDQPMTQDNGELIQYIKGQVNESLETNLPPAVADAINSNTTITGIDKNSKLIPALL